MIDHNKKTSLGFNGGYGVGDIQQYGNEVYMLNMVNNVDERNSTYEIKRYDVDSEKTTILCSINNCRKFFVLNKTIYYSEYTITDDDRILTLKTYSPELNKHETVKESIISFGVIENSVFYLSEENGRIVISQYNNNTKTSHAKGDFFLEQEDIDRFKDFPSVTYAPNYLFFDITNYETEESKTFKYSFASNDLVPLQFDEHTSISLPIPYNAYSYFKIYNENTNVTELYQMNNETNEILQLQTIKGVCSLFVGSDNGVYVYELDNCNINYFSNEPNSKPITVFRLFV